MSHNAGRDADLAFYSVDPSGHPVAPPDLLHFDRNGRSREYGGYYRFDVQRNWALVRALLETPHGELQYLFISNPLRSMLLAHAERIGERPELVAEARRVLYQPGPEIPHDDHLHLRYHCGRADLAAGCTETGPPRRDPVDPGAIRGARVSLASSLLRHGEAVTRARAVDRLALLAARGELEAIHRRFSDPSAWVRARAVAAIGRLGTSAHVVWLTQHWEEEEDGVVREQILLAAAELGGPQAVELIARELRRPRPGRVLGKDYDLRYVAIRSARALATEALVEPLLALLTDGDRQLAAAAHEALREVANVEVLDVDPRVPEADMGRLAAAWRGWWELNRSADRRDWLDAGFVQAGYAVGGSTREFAAELARAAGDRRPWIRRNAQQQLIWMTGNPARSLEWSRHDATAYWTRWVRRNPDRLARR